MKLAGLILSSNAAICFLIAWLIAGDKLYPIYGRGFTSYSLTMAIGVILILVGLLIAALQNRADAKWRWYHTFLTFYITWGLIFLGYGYLLDNADAFWIGFAMPIGVLLLGYAIHDYFH